MRTSLASLAEIVAFCDPASGKPSSTGKKRARSAIVVLGQAYDRRVFVIDAIADRWTTDKLTENIFRLAEQWRPKRFGIESSAQQTLYVDSVIRESVSRRIRIMIVPVSQPTTQTKEFRITTLVQKFLHNGLLYCADHLTELRKEMERYPNGETCDIIDATASALSMLPDPFASKQGLTYEYTNLNNERNFDNSPIIR